MDRATISLNYEGGYKLLSYFIKNKIIELPEIIEYDEEIEKEMESIGYSVVRDWQVAKKDGGIYTNCFILNPDEIINKKTDVDSLITDIIKIIKEHKRMYKKTEEKIIAELKKYDYATVYAVKVAIQEKEDFSQDTFEMIKNMAKVKSSNRVNVNKETVGMVKEIIDRIAGSTTHHLVSSET